MRIWGNKDYQIDKILEHNNFKIIKQLFEEALDANINIGELYDKFIELKHFGPSMVTEIICHLQPKKAGIWNMQARRALIWLEEKTLPLTASRFIIGSEYNQYNEILQKIADKLIEKGLTGVDLLFVDYYLWYVAQNNSITISTAKEEKGITKKGSSINKILSSRHDDLRDKIAAIGQRLGFETETEKKIGTGAVVDTVWDAKIGNLGRVIYVFEVQSKGSIDSLILNLQKSQKNQAVQKLVVVSDKDQIEKIEKEIKELPESFRNAVTFWDDIDVDNTFERLEMVTASIDKLNLIPNF